MRLLVLGAAGRPGRHVVEQALGHGSEVTAFVHTTPLDLRHEALSVVTGDVLDLESVRAAVAGHDAVVSALGPRRGPSGNVLVDGIGNVIHAMTLEGVYRIAAESATGTFARKDKRLGLRFRTMVNTVLKSAYDDLEEMEMRIMASDLEWTIVRPTGLTDGPLTGTYRVSMEGEVLPDAGSISRADVSALLLKSLSGDTYLWRTVTIGY